MPKISLQFLWICSNAKWSTPARNNTKSGRISTSGIWRRNTWPISPDVWTKLPTSPGNRRKSRYFVPGRHPGSSVGCIYILVQAFFWVFQAFERHHLHIHLYALAGVLHLFIRFCLVRHFSFGCVETSPACALPRTGFLGGGHSPVYKAGATVPPFSVWIPSSHSPDKFSHCFNMLVRMGWCRPLDWHARDTTLSSQSAFQK